MSGPRVFGSSSPDRMRQRGTPIASEAAMKSRSTTGCAAPRATRAIRGTVVRAMAATMTQACGPTMATATSASRICGSAMITSMPRIRMSSSALREYAATRPIADADDQPERGRDDGHHEDAAPAVQHPAQHVLPEVVRPEHRLAAGVGVGRPDRGARAVGGDVRPDDRQQHDQADQRDADARPPQPQRTAQQGRAADRRGGGATSASAIATSLTWLIAGSSASA